MSIKVYLCPDHPEKGYKTWRQFRGHWTNKHRGEEPEEKDYYLKEVPGVDKKGRILSEGMAEAILPREESVEPPIAEAVVARAKQEMLSRAGIDPVTASMSQPTSTPSSPYCVDIPRIGEGSLPEDPVERLATILGVHNVEKAIRDQILVIFQMHPGYRTNVANLYYLFTSKLPKRYHQSIPMMLSEFTAEEASPLGDTPPFMLGMGGAGGGPMGMFPPGMGGYPPAGMPFGYPMYPPRYPGGGMGYDLPPRGSRHREDDDEPVSRKREDPITQTLGLVGAIADMMEKMGNKRGQGSDEGSLSTVMKETYENIMRGVEEQNAPIFQALQESQDKFREAIEAIHENNRKNEENLKRQIDELKERHRKENDDLNRAIFQGKIEALQEKLNEIQEKKEEESSSGLGELVREAGMAIHTQTDGIRQSVQTGIDKMTTIAGDLVKNAGAGNPIQRNMQSGTPRTDVTKAASELEAESAVIALANKMGRGA